MKTSHPEAVAASRVNPGETLRKARESKNWVLTEVAAQLNLTPQALQQLESGAFEKLPGHTFARGYVRAYAKLLGMDQNRLVSEFDQFTGSDASGSRVHSLGRIEEPVRLSQSILKMVSLCLLLALGAGAFFWWQAGAGNIPTLPADLGLEHVEVEGADGTTEIHPLDEPEDQAVADAQGAVEPVAPVLPAELAAQPEVPVASEAVMLPAVAAPADAGSQAPLVPQPDAQPPVVPAAPAPAASPVQPAPATPPAPEPAAPVVSEPVVALVPAAGESKVHLQFTADCWTQLTDATGKVLLSALKRRGESIELVGKAPLELRLGFARGAQVRLDGQPVDVAAFTHGETARLKLGQ
ncbi:helix-turn-helix domain-containing protein [Aquipseudomonas campi]|uniref:Helix-turn-helix domain-containing protein n=1 Tax=Aquipseudomonas campi TaxID=2731681 RepID=A0A6M8FKD2_9GAMM|nr:RodZ family helix-turn-helix domain-containing protein [Pseudomonas campi]QKE64339.1 helix-turn-helix domain-containing protein [Pseudomonas campi]